METVETVGDRTVHFRVILRLYPFGYSDENELSTGELGIRLQQCINKKGWENIIFDTAHWEPS